MNAAADHSFSRHIALEGASNFRDFGGYDTPAGKMVAGRMFRSDRLSLLTRADFDVLGNLGLRWVVDLRRSSERQRDPTMWQGKPAPELWHLPLVEDNSGRPNVLQRLAADPEKRNDAEASATVMAEFYADLIHMPFAQQQYRRILQRMVDEGAPGMVVHCSAGKDRTGILVAMIQLALGVSEEDVIADFLLTQRYYDGEKLMHERSSQLLEHEGVEMGEAALLPIFTIQKRYLQAALDEINNHFGGIENYFAKGLELSEDVSSSLRRHLIEE